MCALRTDERPLYTKAARELTARDVGREVRISTKQPCRSCGHYLTVARVVRLSDHEYDYACLGCAVRFENEGPLEERAGGGAERAAARATPTEDAA